MQTMHGLYKKSSEKINTRANKTTFKKFKIEKKMRLTAIPVNLRPIIITILEERRKKDRRKTYKDRKTWTYLIEEAIRGTFSQHTIKEAKKIDIKRIMETVATFTDYKYVRPYRLYFSPDVGKFLKNNLHYRKIIEYSIIKHFKIKILKPTILD